MNNRRDHELGRQQFGHHEQDWEAERYRDREGQAMMGGRGQDDWRSDNQRSGWGRSGGDEARFGGGIRGGMRGSQGGGRFSGPDDGPDSRMETDGRVGPGLRGGRESYGYEGVGGREGMFGGFSYAEDGMRGGPNMSGRRWANEGLASDFSLEGMRNGSRDEQRSNARGQGESEGGVRVSHRGKGPKGYKRSDDRIREDVSEALADHHEIDASEIEVVVKDGEVTLSGTVGDRRTKRLAESIIEHLSGVLDVHNTIRVGAAATQATSSTGGRTNAGQSTTRAS